MLAKRRQSLQQKIFSMMNKASKLKLLCKINGLLTNKIAAIVKKQKKQTFNKIT